jgi:hypothetical protein
MNLPVPITIPGFGRKSMTAYDALNYLVAAMSDGQIGFVSNYLTPVVGQETAHILSGRQLRGDAIDIGPVVSWNELFGDLSKLYNLAFAVEEYNVGQWRIRVEPIDYFRQSQSIQLFDVDAGVTESIDTSMLYASAIVGSSETREDFDTPSSVEAAAIIMTNWNWVPKTPFIFQWQEDYYFQYNSNVDSEWDLRCSVLITHTNLIYYVMCMRVLNTPSNPDFDDSYDEKAFLISCLYKNAPGNVSTPAISGVGGTPPIFNVFNNSISNYNVMVANAEGLPGNAASQYASFGQQYFDAYYFSNPPWQPYTKWNMPNVSGVGPLKNMYLAFDNNFDSPIGNWASNTAIYGPVFDDLLPSSLLIGTSNYLAITASFTDITINGSDPSTGYNPTNFTWVCQVPALYTFKIKGSVFVDWDAFYITHWLKNFYFTVAQWDSLSVGKKTVKKTSPDLKFEPGDNFYKNFEIVFGGFNADVGDVFQVQFSINTGFKGFDVYFSEDTSWSISGNSLEGEGGTILTAEKGGAFMLTNQLKANIDANLWKTIKANPYQKLLYQVTDDGESRSMNLYDFNRNIISGVTEGETRGRLAAPEQPDVDPGNPITPEPEEGDGG